MIIPKKFYVSGGTALAAVGLGRIQTAIGIERPKTKRPTMVILATAALIAIAIEYVEYGLERKFLSKK